MESRRLARRIRQGDHGVDRLRGGAASASALGARAMVGALVGLLLVPTVGAGHGQTGDGREVSFTHKTGNEWWVEVVLGGPGADSVAGVEAMDIDGPWVMLEKKSWGAWAASFRVEPGHDVRFRATWDDGDRVTSCWFSHPDGREMCSEGWNVRAIDRLDGVTSGQLAIGDPDGDGRDELLVATGDGIRIYAWGDGWRHDGTIAPGRVFHEIGVGDADNDGQDEVYAVSDFNDLYRYVWDGAWVGSHSEVPDAGPWSISALAVGDPDDDGGDAVYLGTITDDAPLIEVRIVGGAFEEQVIAEVPGGTVHIWIGDGDDDGDLELLSGSQNRGNDEVRIIDFAAGGWTHSVVDRGHGTSGTAGVVAGDGDGDGSSEVYAARPEPQGVWRSTFDGTWQTERIATLDLWPQDLALGDADNDGVDELYVLANANALTPEQSLFRIVQVKWTGSAWETTQVAQPEGRRSHALAAGDADGDGLQDLYTVAFPHDCCDNSDAIVQQIAEHPPPSPGTELTFDSRNGNEWWVQVHVVGTTPSRVQAMDTGDPWQELALRDWGDWAKSFHVEPGHDVRFRAMVDGTWHTSCWFTHPGGERTDDCPGQPPPQGDFEAAFDTPGGNEWWVEVYVDANQPLAGVDARADGGPWIALEERHWGAWAESFHVEDGAIVEFRATSGGDRVVSDGYVWPEGRRV